MKGIGKFYNRIFYFYFFFELLLYNEFFMFEMNLQNLDIDLNNVVKKI